MGALQKHNVTPQLKKMHWQFWKQTKQWDCGTEHGVVVDRLLEYTHSKHKTMHLVDGATQILHELQIKQYGEVTLL